MLVSQRFKKNKPKEALRRGAVPRNSVQSRSIPFNPVQFRSGPFFHVAVAMPSRSKRKHNV